MALIFKRFKALQFPIGSYVKVQLVDRDGCNWYYGKVCEIVDNEHDRSYKVDFGYKYASYNAFPSSTVYDGDDKYNACTLKWEGSVHKLLRNVNCKEFRTAPTSERYKQIISNSMDLSTVYEKLKMRKYANFSEVESDMNLIFSNAELYNGPDSWIMRDVRVMQNLWQRATISEYESSRIKRKTKPIDRMTVERQVRKKKHKLPKMQTARRSVDLKYCMLRGTSCEKMALHAMYCPTCGGKQH